MPRPGRHVKVDSSAFRAPRHRLLAVSLIRPTWLIAIPLMAILVGACEALPPPATPPILPGSSGTPREVNIITKDYFFLPDVLDLAAGETVLLHVINGGLVVHEAIIGDARVQDAWEIAEALTVGSPPGPTPVVTVPSDVAGVRVVVQSGERVDLVWTVPPDAPASPTPWLVGCHIPGHWARGMSIPIRWAPGSSASGPSG